MLYKFSNPHKKKEPQSKLEVLERNRTIRFCKSTLSFHSFYFLVEEYKINIRPGICCDQFLFMPYPCGMSCPWLGYTYTALTCRSTLYPIQPNLSLSKRSYLNLSQEIRFIPEGKVYNNHGPNPLTGLKKTNPFDCTSFVWKLQLCMILSCACVDTKTIPLLILLMSRIWHSYIIRYKLLTSLATCCALSYKTDTFCNL